MKKLRDVKTLRLNRETLTKLDRLAGAQLGKVAGGGTAACSGASTCLNQRCTCPV
jgi:hypothetical protein